MTEEQIKTLIDPDLQDVIRILNQKGYFTNFCCSGHIDDDPNHRVKQGYIAFSYQSCCPNRQLPCGMWFCNEVDPAIRWEFEDQISLTQQLDNLYNYVYLLPENKGV